MHRRLLLCLLLSGCGDDGSVGGVATVSAGLKIFITDEIHAGDFAGDPTLPGTTAMEKADAFCNRSDAKPSNDTYKALIVDGVSRDAVSGTDWVVRPSTAYYQVFDDVLIGTTSSAAIFTAFYSPMPNPVDPCGTGCPPKPGVWTGIGDASDFAASTNTCARWGQAGSTAGLSGAFGHGTETGAFAFSSGGGSADCASVPLHLYCVQQ